ncbi:MAG: hypothetical protein QW505_03100 [Thermoplasmata archaeon]
MIDVLIGILALLLIFFLPGFFLVLIIFPKRGQLSRDFDLLFKAALGIALSILINVLDVIVLDQLGSSIGTPMITSVALWVSVGLITIVLGIVSWFFGGLKELVLSVVSRQPAGAESADEELRKLAHSKRKLQKKLALLESEAYQSDPALKEEASVRIPVIRQQIADINKKIDEITAKKKEEAK